VRIAFGRVLAEEASMDIELLLLLGALVFAKKLALSFLKPKTQEAV